MVITYGSGPVDVNNINQQCPNPLRMTHLYNTEACTTLLYRVSCLIFYKKIAPSGVMYILTKDSIPYKKSFAWLLQLRTPLFD